MGSAPKKSLPKNNSDDDDIPLSQWKARNQRRKSSESTEAFPGLKPKGGFTPSQGLPRRRPSIKTYGTVPRKLAPMVGKPGFPAYRRGPSNSSSSSSRSSYSSTSRSSSSGDSSSHSPSFDAHVRRLEAKRKQHLKKTKHERPVKPKPRFQAPPTDRKSLSSFSRSRSRKRERAGFNKTTRFDDFPRRPTKNVWKGADMSKYEDFSKNLDPINKRNKWDTGTPSLSQKSRKSESLPRNESKPRAGQIFDGLQNLNNENLMRSPAPLREKVRDRESDRLREKVRDRDYERERDRRESKKRSEAKKDPREVRREESNRKEGKKGGFSSGKDNSSKKTGTDQKYEIFSKRRSSVRDWRIFLR